MYRPEMAVAALGCSFEPDPRADGRLQDIYDALKSTGGWMTPITIEVVNAQRHLDHFLVAALSQQTRWMELFCADPETACQPLQQRIVCLPGERAPGLQLNDVGNVLHSHQEMQRQQFKESLASPDGTRGWRACCLLERP